jgi:cytochrome c peroxidase
MATRRMLGGAALLAGSVAAAFVVSSSPGAAADPGAKSLVFSNGSGVLHTVETAVDPGRDNPFFQELGSNGRTCATCHRPAQAWTIAPAEVRERFEGTGGLDPLFRTNDGSNCAGSDVSTIQARRDAYSLLLTKGLIRVALDVPARAEFEIVAVDDPYRCGEPLTKASMYRRPLPTANLTFLSAVMWDGRATVPGRGINADLVEQALDATIGHAQATTAPRQQLRDLVAFEAGIFTAQASDRGAGSLAASGARGGPATLARQPFCLGINDPLGTLPSAPGACLAAAKGLNPLVFTLFGAWMNDASPERRSIARGEAIFNTRRFVIDEVPGLNGTPSDPVSGPLTNGTCTVCHNTPNAGNHSVSMPLNIGIAAASRRSADLPLYTLRNRTTGELVLTTDPGRAMVTGKWSDIAKFKGPVLRALAARPPYFHDGSAASLADVIEFYDTRFTIHLTDAEKADLLAFLLAL